MEKIKPVIAVLALLLAMGLTSISCAEPGKSVTIAYAPFESNALFWIAVDRGF